MRNQDVSQTLKLLTAILELTKTAGGVEMLIDLNGPEMIMEAMKDHTEDAQIQIQALRALRELCKDEATAVAMLNAGV